MMLSILIIQMTIHLSLWQMIEAERVNIPNEHNCLVTTIRASRKIWVKKGFGAAFEVQMDKNRKPLY